MLFSNKLYITYFHILQPLKNEFDRTEKTSEYCNMKIN